MFKATISNISLIVNPISTIAELIDEGIFKLSKNSISLVAADRAMVAVVDFNILSTAFDKYEIDKDQNIGLNIENLVSVLKRASAGDRITLNLQQAKLEIIIENSSRRRFVLPLLDLSQEEVPPIDQLEFTAMAEVKPEIIQSGIEDAEIVADAVLFEGSASGFSMRAEGDVSSSHLEVNKGDEALLELKTDGEIRARYPLDYLKKMIKAAKIADSAKLEWGQDYPMKLSFKSGDKVSLNFVLAPRVIEE